MFMWDGMPCGKWGGMPLGHEVVCHVGQIYRLRKYSNFSWNECGMPCGTWCFTGFTENIQISFP